MQNNITNIQQDLIMTHLLKTVGIVIVCIILLFVVVYLIVLLHRRRKVELYTEFVGSYYTQLNKPIPIFILCIYNEMISKYNKLLNKGIGRILGFHEYQACHNPVSLESKKALVISNTEKEKGVRC